MSFLRVKPGDWATNELLTSAQMNQLDTNVSNALDIRSGQTNTLQSITTLAGSGRIIRHFVIGPDSDTTYNGASAQLVWVSSLSANRSYQLLAGSTLSADSIVFFCDSSVTHEVVIRNSAGSVFFVLGNLSSSDGPWVEAVFNGGEWVRLAEGGARLYVQQLTGTAWVCPPGVTHVLVAGCGGGGGGGSGFYQNTNVDSTRSSGGGGGGGAIWSVQGPYLTTPGTSYANQAGTGGVGGTGGSAFSSGADGGDSWFDSAGGVLFRGAQGGGTGGLNSEDSPTGFNVGAVAPGGLPSRTGIAPRASRLIFLPNSFHATLDDVPTQVAGQGGCSLASNVARMQAGALAAAQTVGSSAGAAGAAGANDALQFGGCGGGGGGAGGWGGVGGPGGVGGNGGFVTGPFAGNNGGAGSNGGGGGGGGAGGINNTFPAATSGNGGRGGDGLLFVMWWK